MAVKKTVPIIVRLGCSEMTPNVVTHTAAPTKSEEVSLDGCIILVL